jgi:CheY-like chemotaxis protein
MVYGFARQSDGQIRIYSEVGQGTTVKVYLPRHHGEVPQPIPVRRGIEAPRAEEGETVLIVDDEPTVRMLVADTLVDMGYQAIEAGDAASGLRVLESDARVDLLITDVGLPGEMNGKEMADRARKNRPGLKIFFITGFAENAAVSNRNIGPGMHILSKPFAIDKLVARIKALLAEG